MDSDLFRSKFDEIRENFFSHETFVIREDGQIDLDVDRTSSF
jgi:hypothetical protein